MNFVHHIPTKILFGFGQLQNLHLESLPGQKALIVVTKDKAMERFGYLKMLTDELDLAKVAYEIYEEILPNPEVSVIDQGAAFAKETGCDFVIGLGGGSSMDAAKAIAVVMTNGGSFWDYQGSSQGGKKSMEKHPAPVVEVTTTAATGSEVDPWMVVSNHETIEKVPFGIEGVTNPTIAVVDPELMMSVPSRLTAFQGCDIFFHAAESMVNKYQHDMGEMYASKAIELVAQYLPVAVENGNNREAREKIALANCLAAFYMLTTSEHSLEHVLSAYHPTLPHGAGLIMISRAYFKLLVERHCCDDQFVKMARLMGKKEASQPEEFLTCLDNLFEKCGVSDLRMSEFGIEERELAEMASMVRVMDPDEPCDPTDLTEEDFLLILQASFR